MLGINTLSTAQTNAVLSAGEKIGTDDPIAFAYLITLLRSDGATANDATFAELGKYAIVGAGGFESTLTASGVTSTQFANFKSYLVYNPTAGKKTLRNLTASFKTAVDSGDATTAKQEMQKAGGFMADVFMDAASSAGIDMNLILAAHDAAGVVAEAHGEITNQLTPGVKSSMNQSMSAFFQRIAAIKVKNEYTKALTTLNASGTQVDTFNSAVAVMMIAMQAIDSDYADFYNDPVAYCAAQGKTFDAVQAETNARYQAAFSAFQDAITSSRCGHNLHEDQGRDGLRDPPGPASLRLWTILQLRRHAEKLAHSPDRHGHLAGRQPDCRGNLHLYPSCRCRYGSPRSEHHGLDRKLQRPDLLGPGELRRPWRDLDLADEADLPCGNTGCV